MELFSEAGAIKDVRVATQEDGKSRGFAFVEFENAADAQEGLKLNGKELEGRELRLNISKPR